MNDFPMLRLELNASKMTLVKALQDHSGELQQMIERSFNKAIEHIQAQLDSQVQAALSEVIADAVKEAAAAASNGLADELANAMASQVRELVRKRMKSS